MCYVFSTYSTYKYYEVHNKRKQSNPGNTRLQSYGTCVLMQWLTAWCMSEMAITAQTDSMNN